MLRVRLLAGLCLALFAFAGACDSGSGDVDEVGNGPSRPYMLGFSALPRELNADAYAEAIEFAGEHGEVLLIQRTVPWAEFVPGGAVNDATAESTASERDAARDAGLRVFFGIDPTDSATGRDRLGGLPEQFAGRRFDDPDLRSAFVAYAEYVALNYKPAFLALGIEMNLYYEKNEDDWANFRSLYAEAYAAAKRASPDTQITVTLQYEDLQGRLPRDDEHFASWQLVRAFDPIDFIGISTYPGFAFADPTQIPQNYYSQLTAFTDKPIAIAEMGYASAAGGGAAEGTEEAQSAFLQRALDDATDMPMLFAVWSAIWDPTYAAAAGLDAFQSIGLLRADGTEKRAWDVWSSAAERRYEDP